ncbi:MarR family transcriptional regulator [Bradyrhizobium lablabi]|uniref:MarR family winged helix-turn-helix transcriptional regulator n=1 Tax=Bradyrhizobium lablabi TaxID=722472 RepID=UPI001BAC62D6|nr:MarR family transcriptional regulator [Bradyrhizobium lablabi]
MAGMRKHRKFRTARGRPAKKRTGRKSPSPEKSSTANRVPIRSVPPLPGQGKRGEQGYLAYLLRQAQAAARLSMERALADLGVTTPQFVVLTMLKAYPGLSGADLARVAILTPQTVGLIIRNLERDGAIRKTPHPVHGRVLQWTLTRRGTVLLERCRHIAQALEGRLAAGLSPKAELAVRRWLSKIATDLQDS